MASFCGQSDCLLRLLKLSVLRCTALILLFTEDIVNALLTDTVSMKNPAVVNVSASADRAGIVEQVCFFSAFTAVFCFHKIFAPISLTDRVYPVLSLFYQSDVIISMNIPSGNRFSCFLSKSVYFSSFSALFEFIIFNLIELHRKILNFK